MTQPIAPAYVGHRFPPEVIGHAVRLYFRFLSSARAASALGRQLLCQERTDQCHRPSALPARWSHDRPITRESTERAVRGHAGPGISRNRPSKAAPHRTTAATSFDEEDRRGRASELALPAPPGTSGRLSPCPVRVPRPACPCRPPRPPAR